MLDTFGSCTHAWPEIFKWDLTPTGFTILRQWWKMQDILTRCLIQPYWPGSFLCPATERIWFIVVIPERRWNLEIVLPGRHGQKKEPPRGHLNQKVPNHRQIKKPRHGGVVCHFHRLLRTFCWVLANKGACGNLSDRSIQRFDMQVSLISDGTLSSSV